MRACSLHLACHSPILYMQRSRSRDTSTRLHAEHEVLRRVGIPRKWGANPICLLCIPHKCGWHPVRLPNLICTARCGHSSRAWARGTRGAHHCRSCTHRARCRCNCSSSALHHSANCAGMRCRTVRSTQGSVGSKWHSFARECGGPCRSATAQRGIVQACLRAFAAAVAKVRFEAQALCRRAIAETTTVAVRLARACMVYACCISHAWSMLYDCCTQEATTGLGPPHTSPPRRARPRRRRSHASARLAAAAARSASREGMRVAWHPESSRASSSTARSRCRCRSPSCTYRARSMCRWRPARCCRPPGSCGYLHKRRT